MSTGSAGSPPHQRTLRHHSSSTAIRFLPSPLEEDEQRGEEEDQQADDDLDAMLKAAGLLSNDESARGTGPAGFKASGKPEIRDEQIRSYADEFEAEAAVEEIIVGLVPEEDLQRREAELAAMREAEAAEAKAKQAEREELVRQKEAAAKKRLLKEKAAVDARVAKKVSEATEEVEASRGEVHRTFRQAQEALEQRLREQHALVKERYGSLVPGKAATRQVKVEWSKLPQPMEIRCHKARAVKNKLPSGRYVLLVTLYDRLGGNPLRWTRLGVSGGGGDPSMPAATTPIRHRGRFYDSELAFNQSIFATAPPLTDIAPSHVLIFELFVLGGRTQPMDRVVGWTALPCCDRDFQYPSGKFKLPLLRGEMDLGLTRYSAIEAAYQQDLDAWLCNLYLEVVLLPRMTTTMVPRPPRSNSKDSSGKGRSRSSNSSKAGAGGRGGKGGSIRLTQKEYDVELSATSEKLRLRGEFRKPVPFGGGSLGGAGSGAGASELRNRRAVRAEPEVDNEDEDNDDDDDAECEGSDVDDEDVHSGVKGGAWAWAAAGGAAAAGGSAGAGGKQATAEERKAAAAAAAAERARVEAENELLDGGFSLLSASNNGAGGGGRQRRGAKGSKATSTTTTTTAVWRDASEQEAEDVITQGPAVVREGVTKESVLRLGSVKAVKADKVPVTTTAAGTTTAAAATKASAAAMNKGTMPLLGGSGAGDPSPLSTSLLAQPFGRGLVGSNATGATSLAPLSLRSTSLRSPVGGAGAGLSSPFGLLPSPTIGGASLNADGTAAAAASASAAAPPLISLGSFGYSLNKQEQKGLRGARVKDSLRKLKFLKHELIADLKFSSIATFDFWIQLTLLLCALWLRIYIHYLGQWLYLRSLKIPVYEFSPLAYSCTLKYVSDVLPNEVEIGEVLLGPLSVTAIFVLFCLVSWLYQSTLGTFPEIPSRFIAYFGIAAVLDPPLIAIVDAIAGRYDCASRYPVCAYDVASPACQCSVGDAWKLPYRFQQEEGSAVVGILLTVFLYIVIMLISALLLYWYLLHLHLDGRMLDLYRRLHGPEDRFYLPHDFEVSAPELQWIISRARRWRGPRGTTRRVAVCDYVTTDPLDPTFREVSTHVILYHSSLNGSRELYRQFLRLPDGTLLEVFGSLERLLGNAGSSSGGSASGGGGGGGGVGGGSGGDANGLKAVLMAHAKQQRRSDEDGGGGGGGGDTEGYGYGGPMNDDEDGDGDRRSAFAGL